MEDRQHRAAPPSLMNGLLQRIECYERASQQPATPGQSWTALQQHPWEIRCAMLTANGVQEEMLIEALQDGHPLVRAIAVQALAHAGKHAHTDLLLDMLKDHHWQVREATLLALYETAVSLPADIINAALHDSSANVREVAQLVQQRQATHQSANDGLLFPHVHERTQQGMSTTAQSQPAHDHPAMQAQPSPRWRIKRRTSLLLAATAILMLVALTAAGLAWWNTLFGNPDLYQAIYQSQSQHGITITVTRVYSDEGRTVIAYDIKTTTAEQRAFTGSYALRGSVAQRQEVLHTTQCDASTNGLQHCYMIEPAFLVPESVNQLTLTWDINTIIVTGGAKTSPQIAGHWHFSFTVPFHHTNNRELPDPIHGTLIHS